MKLETIEKANKISKCLLRYKNSKEQLTYFTKDNEHIALEIYIGTSSEPFVVPEPIAKRVTDLLHELLDEKIKESEQQLKKL